MFSGLLANLAADLGVSVSTAGQLIAAFAITSAIASPLVVSALTLALCTSVIYLGQGIGAGIGGLVVGSIGFATLGYVGAGIAMVAFVAAVFAKIR